MMNELDNGTTDCYLALASSEKERMTYLMTVLCD